MAFRHTYALQIKTAGQLSIDFTSRGDYYLSDSREKSLTGLSALHALLVCHCGLKEKEDFEVVSKDKANPSITIHRNANIVIALNFLLGNVAAPLFELYSYSYSPQNNPKQQWLIYLGKTIVSCVEDKSLMRKEYETIYPVMRAYLDSQYELLKKEPAVTMLKTAADENYGGDLLKHPFYQTLSILMDDYDTRKGAYKKKGFFEK